MAMNTITMTTEIMTTTVMTMEAPIIMDMATEATTTPTT